MSAIGKSLSGTAFAFDVYQLMPLCTGGPFFSAPFAPRYQKRALVPRIGRVENDCSNVYVLSHHPRSPLAMRNGTTYHFIDASPEEALRLAREAAGDDDVAVGGGTSTMRQFLEAGLIDDLHLVIAPVLLGQGERLFDGVAPAGYECSELRCAGGVAHARITRQAPP